jgi:hypothetical protein
MQVRELPFSMKLIDFRIDEYSPKIGVVDVRSGEWVTVNGITFMTAKKETITEFGSWIISIREFIPDAISDSGNYLSSETEGAAPAAFVEIKDLLSETIITKGWISSGSYTVPIKHLYIDKQYVMVMLRPEAERFSSDIIIDSDKEYDTILLEVNRPHKMKGYNLYQLSYDERMGKWSRTSVVEAVKDPWLTVVYVGVFMLLAGAAYIFWIGNEQKMDTR